MEYRRNSPKENLSGRLAVAPVAQVKMKEYRVLFCFPLQFGDRLFGLWDIRGSDVHGRIVVQESLSGWVIREAGVGTRRVVGTFAVSLPALLFGLVIMTTLPVRSGRLSSFHLGFLSFSEPPRGKLTGSWLEEGSGAGDDMAKERGMGEGQVREFD